MENKALQKKIHLHTGLVAYWPLNGNSLDAIGNNNGTDTNVIYGNCIEIDGTINSAVNIPIANLNYTSGTIAFWLNPKSFTGRPYSDSNGRCYAEFTGGNVLSIIFRDNTNTDHNLTTTATLNTWDFFTVTWDSSFLKLYKNKVLVSSVASTALTNVSYGFNFGGVDGFNLSMQGYLDDATLYNIALDINDIETLYNSRNSLQTIPKTGLVSYYKFNSNLLDSYGTNHATKTGNVTYTGRNEDEVGFFNGTSTYISAPNIAFTTQLTVSCWVKFNVLGGNRSLIGNWQSTGGGDSWILATQGGNKMHFFTSNSTNSTFGTIIESNEYVTNTWYHYVAVFNAGSQQLYRDGVLVANNPNVGFTTLFNDVTQNIWMGHYDIEYLNGSLDEVALWNRALTEYEIKRLYNNGKGLNLTTKPQPISYGNLIQSGLILDLHSGDPISYPGTGNSWYDKSPAASAATIITNSPVYTNGTAPNKYFTLTGTQYVTTPINVQAPTNSNLQTIGTWMKGMVNNYVFFGTNANSSGQAHLCIRAAGSNTIRFEGSYYGGGTGEVVVTSGTLTVNASGWNYVCVVKTAATQYDVYFNGVRVLNNIMRNATSSAAFLCLGKVYNSFIGPSVHGSLHVYNRALSGAEILSNYNAQLPYYSQ